VVDLLDIWTAAASAPRRCVAVECSIVSGYNPASVGNQILAFRRNVVPSSSGVGRS
jgi:hypothetical protein